MSWSVCGVLEGVRCPERCVVSWKVCGVLKGVWCPERCVVSWKVCGVLEGVRCPERCVVSWKVCGGDHSSTTGHGRSGISIYTLPCESKGPSPPPP